MELELSEVILWKIMHLHCKFRFNITPHTTQIHMPLHVDRSVVAGTRATLASCPCMRRSRRTRCHGATQQHPTSNTPRPRPPPNGICAVSVRASRSKRTLLNRTPPPPTHPPTTPSHGAQATTATTAAAPRTRRASARRRVRRHACTGRRLLRARRVVPQALPPLILPLFLPSGAACTLERARRQPRQRARRALLIPPLP